MTVIDVPSCDMSVICPIGDNGTSEPVYCVKLVGHSFRTPSPIPSPTATAAAASL